MKELLLGGKGEKGQTRPADRNICFNMSKFIRHLALRAHGNLWTVVQSCSSCCSWVFFSFLSFGWTIVNVHYIW